MRECRLTTELSDAGGLARPNSQPTRPARIRSSDFVRRYGFCLHHLCVSFQFDTVTVSKQRDIDGEDFPIGPFFDRCEIADARYSGMAAPFSIHSRIFAANSAWLRGGFEWPAAGSQPVSTSESSAT